MDNQIPFLGEYGYVAPTVAAPSSIENNGVNKLYLIVALLGGVFLLLMFFAW